MTYSFQKISFNSQSTSSSINAQTANNITMPISSLQANADITDAATTPIPSSQANAVTNPSSEWRLNTKRAINEISKEIKQLKRARRHLKKALEKEH